MNDFDLQKALREHNVPHLVYNGQDSLFSNEPIGWFLRADGKYKALLKMNYPRHLIGKGGYWRFGMRDESGSRISRDDCRYREVDAGDTYLAGHWTFDEVVEAAKSLGFTGSWSRLKKAAFDCTYFPTGTGLPESITSIRPKLQVAEGSPCLERVHSQDRGGGSHTCLRIVEADDLCKMHLGHKAKRATEAADRSERYAARRAADRRDAESLRAATETLDEMTALLTELGMRPDTFKADVGGIQAPAETVRELVRLAALAYELDL